MPYPEQLLITMRAGLTQYGVKETRTPAELDEAIASHGAVLHLQGVPPSSPSLALLRDGKAVWAMHRFQIESRQAPEIAADIVKAFDEFRARQTA